MRHESNLEEGENRSNTDERRPSGFHRASGAILLEFDYLFVLWPEEEGTREELS